MVVGPGYCSDDRSHLCDRGHLLGPETLCPACGNSGQGGSPQMTQGVSSLSGREGKPWKSEQEATHSAGSREGQATCPLSNC